MDEDKGRIGRLSTEEPNPWITGTPLLGDEMDRAVEREWSGEMVVKKVDRFLEGVSISITPIKRIEVGEMGDGLIGVPLFFQLASPSSCSTRLHQAVTRH